MVRDDDFTTTFSGTDAGAIPRAAWSGPVSFLLVGGAGAAAFVLLSDLGLQLWPAAGSWISVVAYGLLIGPVYLLHRRFSFGSAADHRRALPRYLAVQCGALVLSGLFGLALHGVLALPSLPASVLVAALTAAVNFGILKAWAFRADGRVRSA